jgi:Leucine-rich repeat (LRR) protein
MRLPDLTSLTLSFNRFDGNLPMEYKTLENLQLDYNKLIGKIPMGFFANAPSLRHLNIGSNIIIGTIPSDVGMASNMQYLDISENLLGGQLPLSIYNLPLMEFRAQGNFIGGSLALDSLSLSLSTKNGWETQLQTLWLSGNRLVGTLPTALASFSNLRHLVVGGNHLNGPLSTSLSQLSLLQRLDVSDNDMVGVVPSELALLPSLESLKLCLNLFSGAIPDSLCTISSSLVQPLELEADCLPLLDGPSNQCLCCTICCDRTTGMCQPEQVDSSVVEGLNP